MHIRKIKIKDTSIIYHYGAKTKKEQAVMFALNGLALEAILNKLVDGEVPCVSKLD